MMDNMDEMDEKTVATSNTAQQLHGVNGLMSGQGLERDVITAHVRPRGIATVLPIFPTVNEDPRFPAITGVTATTGVEPTVPCEDAPTSYIKVANLTAKLGMTRFDTETIDIGKVMLRKNRGDLTDFIVRGRLLGLTNLEPSSITEDQILNIMTRSEMVKAGVNVERKLSKTLWQGTAAANSFPGLDVQIATGQSDADTGAAAPALDSDIKEFNYGLVGGTGPDISEYLGSMMFYLEYNAESMGLDPVEFVIAMRPELWFELSAVWPVRYNTTKTNVTVPANNTVFIDGRQNITDRDLMRQNMYLDINGKRYRVVIDTGIYEHNNANDENLNPGEYASSIYAVPLTIQGGFPVTYREYLDFRAAQPDVSLLKGMENFWTDDGIYTWSITQEKWCYKMHLRTEQRVILRTPHLAGKIQKVKYMPTQHLRGAYPEDPYHMNGGVSMRVGSTGQAVWK
jgi:hypothetical protein